MSERTQQLVIVFVVAAIAVAFFPVAVPTPVAGGEGWMAYPLLLGVPLLTLDPRARAALAGPTARSLGRVLARLWATPRAEVEGLVEDDRTPLSEWREEAAGLASELADELPERVRALCPLGPRRARALDGVAGCGRVNQGVSAGRSSRGAGDASISRR